MSFLFQDFPWSLSYLQEKLGFIKILNSEVAQISPITTMPNRTVPNPALNWTLMPVNLCPKICWSTTRPRPPEMTWPPLIQAILWGNMGCQVFKGEIQVNLCQKLLFLHQLTHNTTTDCSLNYKFNTWKFQAQTWGELVVYRNCFWHSEQLLYATRSLHVLQK